MHESISLFHWLALAEGSVHWADQDAGQKTGRHDSWEEQGRRNWKSLPPQHQPADTLKNCKVKPDPQTTEQTRALCNTIPFIMLTWAALPLFSPLVWNTGDLFLQNVTGSSSQKKHSRHTLYLVPAQTLQALKN